MDLKNFYNRYYSKGFTLIEIMVVITITAILVAVAIPNYKAYLHRANVSRMVTMVDPCQIGIYKYILKYGILPDGSSTGQTIVCQGVTMTNVLQQIPSSDSSSPIKAKYQLINSNSTNVARFTLTHSSVKEANHDPCELYIDIQLNSDGENVTSCKTNCTTKDFFPANCTLNAN